jgi:hypothetical protein
MPPPSTGDDTPLGCEAAAAPAPRQLRRVAEIGQRQLRRTGPVWAPSAASQLAESLRFGDAPTVLRA